VRGAFTGADRSRDGKFLLADGGTLFLDEIGDMSLRVQAKVLRALQEGEIERVGDSKTHHVNVRVLAATNKDLPAEVSAGRFREDLFFRLNVVPLAVPPLRERPDDIRRLAEHFLELYAVENELPRKELGAGARERLERMPWRGNVRELRNVIERLAILSDGPVISEDDVRRLAPPDGLGDVMAALRPAPPAVEEGDAAQETAAAAPGDLPISASGPVASRTPTLDEIRELGGLVEARRDFERRCIEMCLDQSGGNVSKAARLLGVERSNLHKKMVSLGLEARAARRTE
jgi:transcriptional regulator with GAF, ATPase, and Fis domain